MEPEVTSGSGAAERRLSSWKEIAAYFERDVRTVQLWEQKEGLPIHRQEHSLRASVYAYPSELDLWFNERLRKRPTETEPSIAEIAVAPSLWPTEAGRTWKWLVPLASTIVIAAAAWMVWRAASAPRLPGNGTLAVLPFLNLTGNNAQDYLSDGITDELTTLVASQLRLKVVARTSAFQFKGKNADVRSIGYKLDAGMILEGSVSAQGDELRINVQLIRASDGYHLWSHFYDTSHGDSMAIEQQIVRDIGGVLRLRPAVNAPNGEASLDQQAHNFDLLGEYYWNRRSAKDDWKAIEFFNQAIEREPLYARAYLGMAKAYMGLGRNDQAAPGDVFPKAHEAANKALQIDPGLSEAQAVLAHLMWYYDWHYPAAEDAYRKVIAADPNLPIAHLWYGLMLMDQRRFDEARRELDVARALDPLNPIYLADESRVALYSANYSESIRLSEEALRGNPNFPDPHNVLARAYLYEGNAKAALDEFEKYYELSGHEPVELTGLADAYARWGIAPRRSNCSSRQTIGGLHIRRIMPTPSSMPTSATRIRRIFGCKKPSTCDCRPYVI
ncbi:MAG: tetratricopeptide repeat protein [Terracidiphilus sp.]|jgi:TolB-like protein/Tfp pilus assembly protein PilF